MPGNPNVMVPPGETLNSPSSPTSGPVDELLYIIVDAAPRTVTNGLKRVGSGVVELITSI